MRDGEIADFAAQRKNLERIAEMVRTWPLRRGKQEWLSHLEGEDTTRGEAMRAKCYDCMGGYDEIGDCRVPGCALYRWMPYREGGRKRVMSEKELASRTSALEKARYCRKSPKK